MQISMRGARLILGASDFSGPQYAQQRAPCDVQRSEGISDPKAYNALYLESPGTFWPSMIPSYEISVNHDTGPPAELILQSTDFTLVPVKTIASSTHAEVMEDGSQLGIRPLRGAQCVDEVISSGERLVDWPPNFIFHGFPF